mmetsp:Transcript_1194/g.3488  ORF Transcript_1194/g.3488 Transcript_1194/m.3488 type:complete len:283 (-) Transcript_1194:465-1313(-)
MFKGGMGMMFRRDDERLRRRLAPAEAPRPLLLRLLRRRGRRGLQLRRLGQRPRRLAREAVPVVGVAVMCFVRLPGLGRPGGLLLLFRNGCFFLGGLRGLLLSFLHGGSALRHANELLLDAALDAAFLVLDDVETFLREIGYATRVEGLPCPVAALDLRPLRKFGSLFLFAILPAPATTEPSDASDETAPLLLRLLFMTRFLVHRAPAAPRGPLVHRLAPHLLLPCFLALPPPSIFTATTADAAAAAPIEHLAAKALFRRDARIEAKAFFLVVVFALSVELLR